MSESVAWATKCASASVLPEVGSGAATGKVSSPETGPANSVMAGEVAVDTVETSVGYVCERVTRNSFELLGTGLKASDVVLSGGPPRISASHVRRSAEASCMVVPTITQVLERQVLVHMVRGRADDVQRPLRHLR
jgi:hypothetical protein